MEKEEGVEERRWSRKKDKTREDGVARRRK
jgi:hypothetical protein